MLRDFVAEPGRAVLMSSHITSDLERIADRIVCIDAGRIVFDLPKDVITDEMGVARCRVADLETIAAAGGIVPERRAALPAARLRHRRARARPLCLCGRTSRRSRCDRMTIDDYMALTLKGRCPIMKRAFLILR